MRNNNYGRSPMTPSIRNLLLIFFLSACASVPLCGQNLALPPLPVVRTATQFRVGERLTYNVSLDRFRNAAYAEMYTVSGGKIGDREVVELRSKIKTLEFVSAAYFLIDQSRRVYAAPDTGLPVNIQLEERTGGLPKETFRDYLLAPTSNFDLLTMIYHIRHSSGIGSLVMQERERTYTVSYQPGTAEKVKTDAGEFDTVVSTVTSDYFADIGVRDVRINLSTDEAKLPVLIRFKTSAGEFRGSLASVQSVAPEAVVVVPPVPVAIPIVKPTPVPAATPAAYVDNRPLDPELGFALGETLQYTVSQAGRPSASFSLEARERKQFGGLDSLLLALTITGSQPGVPFFRMGDSFTTQVDPETLVPRQMESKFNGTFSGYDQQVTFDGLGGIAVVNGTNRIEVPVRTHDLLSLLYAIRSFNLKPSKDPNNPVNDTRVAVFWENKPLIFTLRPSEGELITFAGEKIAAQLIAVTTGSPDLDALNIRIWLSTDERRVPLRIVIGQYQADLVASTIVAPD